MTVSLQHTLRVCWFVGSFLIFVNVGDLFFAFQQHDIAEIHDTLDDIHDAINTALTAILRMIPAASTAVFPHLLENFPHKSHSITAHKVCM